MAPATYAGQCMGCHPLEYDSRMQDSVPHAKPEIVHSYLVSKFSAYIAAHPNEVHMPSPGDRRIPREQLGPVPANGQQWVALRVAESEHLLWSKTCVECHTLTSDGAAGAFPQVTPAGITTRWLKRASFDHAPHSITVCATCHAKAAGSQQASDILIPGVEVCRNCHTQSRKAVVAAGSNCVECHAYHDWSKEKDVVHAVSGL